MWFQVSLLTLISNLPEQRWLLIAGCNLLVSLSAITDGGQATKMYCKEGHSLSNIGAALVAQETTLCSNGIKRNICVSSHLNYEQNGYAFVMF